MWRSTRLYVVLTIHDVLFSCLCCPTMCLYVLNSVLWCPRQDCRIQRMFGSSLPSFACRRSHFIFTLCVFVCLLWFPTHIVLCFVFFFVLCTICCQYLWIVSSVFSNVYLYSVQVEIIYYSQSCLFCFNSVFVMLLACTFVLFLYCKFPSIFGGRRYRDCIVIGLAATLSISAY